MGKAGSCRLRKCTVVISFVLASLQISPTNTIIMSTTPQSPLEPLSDGNSDLADDLHLIRKYCPTTRTCQDNPLGKAHAFAFDNYNATTNGINCCLPCDCSDDCFAIGNCCYDKERSRPTSNLTIPTTSDGFACIFTQYPIYPGEQEDNIFLMVQICDSGDAYNVDRRRCLTPDDNNIDDMTPVFSSVTKKNYRNTFCARCNNEDVDYIAPWNLQVSCEGQTFPNIPQERESILTSIRGNEKCATSWIPVNRSYTQQCFNGESFSTSCVNNYDPELEAMCLKDFVPIRGRTGRMYKNAYCRACEETLDPLRPECIEHDILNTLLTHKLSTLLSQTFYKNSKKIVLENKLCTPPLTYVPEMNECLRLACALTEVEVDGRCFPMLTHVSGVNLDYRINLVFPIDNVTLPTISDMLELAQSVKERTPANDTKGFYCTNTLHSMISTGTQIIVTIQIAQVIQAQTNLKEEYDALEAIIDQSNNQLNENGEVFKYEIGTSPYKTIPLDQVSIATYSDVDFATNDYCMPYGVAVSHIQFCPTVQVHDYIMLSNSTIKVQYATFNDNEYVLRTTEGSSNNVVSICLSLYTSRMAALNSAGGFVMTKFSYIAVFWYLVYGISILVL